MQQPIRINVEPFYNQSELLQVWTKGDEVEFRGAFGNNSGGETLNRIQEIMFGVMGKYGFNPDVFHPDTTVAPDGIIRYQNGTAIETRLYPTSTPGLFFRRERNFYTDSDATYAFGWNTLDRAPNRLDLRGWWQSKRSPTLVYPAGQ